MEAQKLLAPAVQPTVAPQSSSAPAATAAAAASSSAPAQTLLKKPIRQDHVDALVNKAAGRFLSKVKTPNIPAAARAHVMQGDARKAPPKGGFKDATGRPISWDGGGMHSFPALMTSLAGGSAVNPGGKAPDRAVAETSASGVTRVTGLKTPDYYTQKPVGLKPSGKGGAVDPKTYYPTDLLDQAHFLAQKAFRQHAAANDTSKPLDAKSQNLNKFREKVSVPGLDKSRTIEIEGFYKPGANPQLTTHYPIYS